MVSQTQFFDIFTQGHRNEFFLPRAVLHKIVRMTSEFIQSKIKLENRGQPCINIHFLNKKQFYFFNVLKPARQQAIIAV